MVVLEWCCASRLCFCFFGFKQRTAYEMRMIDWSSDVCSSDLSTAGAPVNTHVPSAAAASRGALRTVSLSALSRSSTCLSATPVGFVQDRKSVVEGQSVSVRVDLGGRRIIQNKRNRPVKH